MNEYDKAGRYLIKRDPTGFCRWLLRRQDVAFCAWIDARRHALPHQGDLTNDLVAAFRVDEGFEGLCVELQAESAADSAARLLLGYLPRLLSEPAGEGSLALSAAGGAVVNLTGPGQPGGVEQRPTVAPDCWLAGGILQRTLRTEDAAATLRDIAAGAISRWLLAWLPLMQGGAEAGIMEAWKIEAAKESQEYDQRLLAHLTLTFAGLAQCRAAWQHQLEGWAVIKSEYLEELREEVRSEARAEGKAEGRMETLRQAILRLGRQRFDKVAGRKQKAQLNEMTDVPRLERILDRVLDATSWDELLATP
ncbi:MAG TPA: hypothetical protein VKA46_14595 [Gemmataceae bacterium]|nr:hypothetical protein [Gemmataceae bacterium]